VSTIDMLDGNKRPLGLLPNIRWWWWWILLHLWLSVNVV